MWFSSSPVSQCSGRLWVFPWWQQKATEHLAAMIQRAYQVFAASLRVTNPARSMGGASSGACLSLPPACLAAPRPRWQPPIVGRNFPPGSHWTCHLGCPPPPEAAAHIYAYMQGVGACRFIVNHTPVTARILII